MNIATNAGVSASGYGVKLILPALPCPAALLPLLLIATSAFAHNTQKGNADACTKRSQCCHPPGGREACLAIAWPKNTCGKFHIALHVFIRFVIVVVVVGESHTTLEHSASLFFVFSQSQSKQQ